MPARFSPYVRLRRRGDSRIARLFDMCAGRGRLIAAPPENLGSPRRGRRPRRPALPPLKGEVAEPLAAKPEGSQIYRKGACSLRFALLTTPQPPPSNGGDSSPCRGARAPPRRRGRRPPCGARKTHRAYAISRVFRPLRKLPVPFFRHRRREPAIPRRPDQKTKKHPA